MSTPAEIAARLGLRKAAGGWAGCCPACGYKTGLRLNEKGGKTMWWCASCQDQPAVTAAIVAIIGGGSAPPLSAAAAASGTGGAMSGHARPTRAPPSWSHVRPQGTVRSRSEARCRFSNGAAPRGTPLAP
jgi:hypothetical protein